MSKLGIAVALAIVMALTVPALAQVPGEHTVTLANSQFIPKNLYIEPGQTVTWRVNDGNHTITDDGNRFDRQVAAGDTFTFTYPTAGIYAFHCRFHSSGPGGVGMVGKIYVGVPIPTPTPAPTPIPPPQRYVPSPYRTISEALTGAEAGTVINVAPGRYAGDINVLTPRIVIRGTGASPSDVLIAGGLSNRNGVTVRADGVRIENLTVSGYTETGITVRAVAGAVIRTVRAIDNRIYGIAVVAGASKVQVRDSEVRGSGEAGVTVRSCKDCDTVIDRVVSSGNVTGYAGINSGGVSVTRSTFTGNGTGVILQSNSEAGAPQAGSHLWGNTISSNNDRTVVRRGNAAARDVPVGTGVWIAGGLQDTVEANTISDNERYGVAVTWMVAPSVADRVVTNTVSGSGKADLVWDGIGAGVCFSGNVPNPTSSPPDIQTLYSCSAVVTVGIPIPTLTLEMLGVG